jgi:hypothetical protein
MVPLKAQVLPIFSTIIGVGGHLYAFRWIFSIRYVSNHPNREREHQSNLSLTDVAHLSWGFTSVKSSMRKTGYILDGCFPQYYLRTPRYHTLGYPQRRGQR